MLSSVGAKRRKSWLLAASALASSSLGVSGPALAQCSAVVSGNATCSSGTYTDVVPQPPGTFPAPITYSLATNVTLDPGVIVTLTNPGVAVNLNNFGGGGAVSLSANGVTINVTNPAAGDHRGLYVETSSSNATIVASGQIDVAGVQGSHAIKAFVNTGPGDASVTYNGPSLSSTGANSTDIQAQSINGNATIVASGNLSGHVLTNPATGANDTFVSLFANAGGNGNASVTYRSGTINVQGRFSNGIFAGADGNGTAQVTTLPGTTIIVSGTLPGESTPTQSLTAGITAELGGAAALGSAITVNAASTINMFGKETPNTSIFGNPVGIRAISRADAPITVNYTGPGITTQGGGGIGILALANNGGGGGSSSGGVTVASSGPITTSGREALGIVADSGTIYNATHGRPQLGPGGNVAVTASAAITTQGDEAHGIWAASTTGTVQVNATNNISTTGQFSTGINAISTGVPATGPLGGNVAVNVAPGVSVMGGWQAGVTGVGSSTLFALPSAGVILSSTGGTATLTNFGSIGALSDRALAGDPMVFNNGTITGFVQFTGGDNSITNNGTFNLRHFADTTGTGRDTLRVAIADLGNGPNNSFTNNGTLALPQVNGATKLDSTGQYLPLGNPNNAMALGGPLQGHLIGVTTFTNSGTIDLQSNPVAGDVLVITGARQAGVAGPGTFISNGGTLKLDTVLNEGGTATRSDTLVVDGTSVGAGGATIMAIRNAGGAGARTVGDGILVTQVLNPALSASGAFRLSGGTISTGAFDYVLFKGGVSPGTQGNWYLRSTLVAGPEPAPGSPSLPTPDPSAGEIPLYRPEVALHAVLPSVARSAVRTTLGTFHDREGEQAFASGDGAFQAGWARLFGGSYQQSWSGDVSPAFHGNVLGVQAGLPFFGWDHSNAEKDRAGVFVGYTYAYGSVTGFADGQQGFAVGSLGLNAYSVGLYWTHFWPAGGYLDAVLMESWLTSSTNSVRNISTASNGRIGTASLEMGYPIPVWSGWAIEPQAQFIFQHWGDDLLNDPYAQVSTVENNAFISRFGLRLTGNLVQDKMVIKPFALVNLWRDFGGQDTIAFNQTSIATNQSVTALEFGGGLSASIGKSTDVYAKATYTTDIDGNFQSAFTGKLGFRLSW